VPWLDWASVNAGQDAAFGAKAMPWGSALRAAAPAPPAIVVVTVLVAGSMMVKLPDSTLPTHTCEPSGVTATEPGRRPAGIVATSLPVAVLMASTESEFMSVT
jgi:hypothetical protein